MGTVCNGCLVLHRDATVAFCTEELDGGSCVGYDRPHRAGTMPCRITPRVVRCRHCEQTLQLRLLFSESFHPELPERTPTLVN